MDTSRGDKFFKLMIPMLFSAGGCLQLMFNHRDRVENLDINSLKLEGILGKIFFKTVP